VKRPRFVIYPAKDGFRWRLLAANNRLIAESGEAYTRERDAERAVKAVKVAVARSSWPAQGGATFVFEGKSSNRTYAQSAAKVAGMDGAIARTMRRPG
jgi:uncharacterized protein YegP (UPF0339 family)